MFSGHLGSISIWFGVLFTASCQTLQLSRRICVHFSLISLQSIGWNFLNAKSLSSGPSSIKMLTQAHLSLHPYPHHLSVVASDYNGDGEVWLFAPARSFHFEMVWSKNPCYLSVHMIRSFHSGNQVILHTIQITDSKMPQGINISKATQLHQLPILWSNSGNIMGLAESKYTCNIWAK